MSGFDLFAVRIKRMETDAQVDRLEPQRPRCWLEVTVPDNRPKITWSAKGGSPCSITLTNLTDKELDAIEAFLRGTSYIRCVDGRLCAYDTYKPLPDPVTDQILAPHWMETPGEIKRFGEVAPGEGWHRPGIVITAVGAGSSDPRDRACSRSVLAECGFHCLRSVRGNDGGYWEQWVLHSVTLAAGPLKECMQQWCANNPKRHWLSEVEEAARYITRDLRVRYGSLDITIQRWALCIDD